MTDLRKDQMIALTAGVVGAFVGNHRVTVVDLPGLVRSVYSALATAGVQEASTDAAPLAKPTPAQIRKSITPDALISFEDGQPYKMLKRHLAYRGMTVAEYKAKWDLPKDYPMVAPRYSEKRSALAKSIGLGQGGRIRSKGGKKAS